MSNKLTSLVWEQSPLKDAPLLVLLTLADMAGNDNSCWPSYETLAKRARISHRYAIEIMGDLIESGVVTRVYRDNSSNVYTIHPDKIGKIEQPIEQPEQARGEPQITPGVNSTSLGGDPQFTGGVIPSSPKSLINHQLTTAATDKIRAVCNASPAWAIAHGETPTPITDEQRERDNINQFAQQYQGFAEAYILETKRLATKNEISRWSLAFKEMAARGVTPEILTATIREMRNKGLTNTWPGSCTNMAAAKVAGRKRVEVETPAPLEDIFSRPAFIPETRWRKATQ